MEIKNLQGTVERRINSVGYKGL